MHCAVDVGVVRPALDRPSRRTVLWRGVGVGSDMCEGRAAIYVDMLGYDEVAHRSGPERVDTLAVLRDPRPRVGRIERTADWGRRVST